MAGRNMRATTAMGLCLTLAPLAVAAQGGGAAEGADLFVAPVETCLTARTSADCAPFQAALAACAGDLGLEECGPLLRDQESVMADPVLRERAMAILAEVAARLAESEEVPLAPVAPGAEAEGEVVGEAVGEAEVVPGPESGDPDAVEEMATSEAGAETSGDMLDADSEAETGVEAAEGTEEAAPEVAEGAPDEGMAAEPGDDVLAEEAPEDAPAEEAPAGDAPAEEAVAEDAPSEEAAAEDVPAEDALTGDAVAEDALAADDLAETTEPEVAEPDAPVEEEGAAGDEAAEAQPEGGTLADGLADAVGEALGEAGVEAGALDALMGDEAPVVIEEEVTAEVPLAPAEELPEIGAEEAAAIAEIMAAPEVSAAVETLDRALGAGEGDVPVAARAGLEAEGEDAPAPADVVEAEIAADGARESGEAFGSDFALDFEGVRDGLQLEEAGLAALAALVVGMSIDGDRVVARSDERVVVQDDAGGFDIWRDDDAVLARQGAERRIERYEDGSTLTRWVLADGGQVITVRDATGRVLLRERVLADGTRVELINDLRAVEPVDVAALPRPVAREVVVGERTDPEAVLAILRAAEDEARALGRGFSLRQVREIREVRELVPVLSAEPIIFESDRAEVRAEEARKLAQLGVLMEMLVAENPGEVFLIEGHTDATGPAAYNIGLSDRRAESVALALIELFGIPPASLVIEGYGEAHLRMPTLEAEARNRRVTVRRITPLLATGG